MENNKREILYNFISTIYSDLSDLFPVRRIETDETKEKREIKIKKFMKYSKEYADTLSGEEKNPLAGSYFIGLGFADIVKASPHCAREVLEIATSSENDKFNKEVIKQCARAIVTNCPQLTDEVLKALLDKDDNAEGKELELIKDTLCIVDYRKNTIYFNVDGKSSRGIYDLSSILENVSRNREMNISTSYDRIHFDVCPQMNAEEIFQTFKNEEKRFYEEYKKSSEYAEEKKEDQERVARKKAKELSDNILIKNEELDIEGHTQYFAIQKMINSGSMFDYAVRWGKLMQAEMKKQGLNHLTKELVRDTENRADIYSCISEGIPKNFLIAVWKHGDELAAFTGVNKDRATLWRIFTSNKAINIYNSYKPGKYCDTSDEKYRIKEAAGIIAELVDDKRFIDRMFILLGRNGTKGTYDYETLKNMIPIIHLNNKLKTLYDVCQEAKMIIDRKQNTETKIKDTACKKRDWRNCKK